MPTNNQLHLAIIPDGNRRWARAQSLLPWQGHERAIENFRSLTDWCRNHPDISTLTVWCFSTENWKRDQQEVNRLMTLLEQYLRKERESFVKEQTRFCHSGRHDRLPPSLVVLLKEVEEETKNQTGFTLHLAVDYGGMDEVARAVSKLDTTANVTEADIRAQLDHPELPDIDLVIRTSGERRTSNFFLWQAAYAEWAFLEKHFPDLTTEDLTTTLDDYQHRTRRFGS